jgi:hypothetical protein
MKINVKQNEFGNKLEEIAEKFTQWSLSASFHCFPKIFKNSHIIVRLTWSLFFASFFLLTFKYVYRSIDEYLEYDVVSKIRVFSEKSSFFPTVTICDANPFTSKMAAKILKKHWIKRNSTLKYNNKSYIVSALIDMENLKNMAFEEAFNLSNEEKRNLGFSLDQIQLCYFNEVECSNEDFYWFFSYKWGSCYQFNSGKNTTQPLKQTKLGGRNYGLGLFIGPLFTASKYPTFHSKGLRIFVHNNSFLSSTAEEILVETGKHSSISIKKTIMHKTPMPHSECQDLGDFKSNLYDYIKLNHVEYRQKDCFELCLQKLIIDECKCFYPWLSVYGKMTQPCFNSTQFHCLAKKFNEVIDEIETMCSPQCPLECDSITYDLGMSSLRFPNKQFYDSLELKPKVLSYNKFRRLYLNLEIFFPVKQYTEISENPKVPFADLVSNIGGALGVFLGLSVFSFIEIFELFIQVLFLFFKIRKSQSEAIAKL